MTRERILRLSLAYRVGIYTGTAVYTSTYPLVICTS